jgi:hypothetical protein
MGPAVELFLDPPSSPNSGDYVHESDPNHGREGHTRQVREGVAASLIAGRQQEGGDELGPGHHNDGQGQDRE